jgi:exodeoxyribonuclease V gamma subunit
MFLYRSNRSERLVDELARIVRQPQADPFAPELVVVQSKGMERWLALELSRRLGVCSQVEFPFPRHLLDRIFDALLQDPKELSVAFEQRQMMWSIAALLPDLLPQPEFAPIAGYLADDVGGSSRIALAQRLARVFDDYSVYRPELLLAWERGEEQGWEASLWRALVEKHGRGHQAARAERVVSALAQAPLGATGLPARLCLFGISSLPPLYLSMLSALSAHVETHLFVLSPSREYLGGMRGRAHAGDPALQEGHPLLASLGRLGREFQELLEERTQYREGERDLYCDPGTDDLLHCLQSDILALRNRGQAPDAPPQLPLRHGDESLSVHICHGPMREVEVLHDQLAALLENPDLQPHEIVVMTPEIEVYAPIIEAVFGQKSGRPQLPYAVADRKTRATHELVDALYALIETLQGRMSASAVLDLLSLDCIRRRFAIASEQLDTLRGWVERAGARWGVDAAHRHELDQPAVEENTWRFGLDRMLLGYGVEGHGRRLFAGVLPLDEIEGSEGELLGKLAELCERLFRHRLALRDPRPVAEWRDELLRLLEELTDPGPAAGQEQQLIALALAGLVEAAEAAGFREPIDLRTLTTQLGRALDDRLPSHGLLDRGITFCQLVPMRSIPFKVVCLIGMNDDAFPGADERLGFDRLADKTQRRVGDRSRRDDDRYMFLEALLSARERLLISYIGRGIHDNRVRPPSVVVGELMDAIERGFAIESEAAAGSSERRAALEARLCTLQRLHAFSPRYFDRSDPRLFSYANDYCDGARALSQPRRDPRFLERPLPAPTEPLAWTLEELCTWLTVPIRTFLQRKLGVYLGQEIAGIPDREPFELQSLGRWQLGTDLLAPALSGHALDELGSAVQARGVLPLGTAGGLAYASLTREVDALAQATQRYRGGGKLEALALDLQLDGMRLQGTIDDLWPGGHLFTTYSRIGRRFELVHFIRHVALSCALAQKPRAGYPRHSVIVARAEKGDGLCEVMFAPLEDPERVLQSLLAFAREAQRSALPFVYEPARAFAEALYGEQGSDRAKAIYKAKQEYEDEFGADKDAYVRLMFPNFAAFTAEQGALGFVSLVETVLGPLFRARSER